MLFRTSLTQKVRIRSCSSHQKKKDVGASAFALKKTAFRKKSKNLSWQLSGKPHYSNFDLYKKIKINNILRLFWMRYSSEVMGRTDVDGIANHTNVSRVQLSSFFFESHHWATVVASEMNGFFLLLERRSHERATKHLVTMISFFCRLGASSQKHRTSLFAFWTSGKKPWHNYSCPEASSRKTSRM